MTPRNETDPIPYRNVDDDRLYRQWDMPTFLLGVLLGVALVIVTGFCGAVGFLRIGGATRPPPPQSGAIYFTAAYVASGIALAIGGAWLVRRKRGRFFLAGFLLGAAVTCMIEGTCFLTL